MDARSGLGHWGLSSCSWRIHTACPDRTLPCNGGLPQRLGNSSQSKVRVFGYLTIINTLTHQGAGWTHTHPSVQQSR